MKNNERIIYGLAITIVIFAIASYFGNKIPINIDFISSSFGTHSIMLLLSIFVIFILGNIVNYKISLPKFKKIFRPILFGILATIVINILMVISIKISGVNIEAHAEWVNMRPSQMFIFIFIYASITEELLFRGFLQNLLKPLKSRGITVFKRKISIPVIISSVAFGLAHLILIKTGVSFIFLLRMVAFATILGLIAGYYQEKYNNNAYAIIVHMAGNSIGLLALLLMNLSE